MSKETWLGRAVGGLALLTVMLSSAFGAPYAYMTTGSDEFGVLNLGTGVFTKCGTGGVLLTGLGVGPDGVLFSAASGGQALYTVDPVSGALTLVGNSSIAFEDIGSTTRGRLYALDKAFNLYKLNPTTAAAKLIGPTGLPGPTNSLGMSAGSASLYISSDLDLYKVNIRTGVATKIGTGSRGFGALVTAKSTLYGGAGTFNQPGTSIYTIDTTTAADTFVANVTGTTSNFWGLAPAPSTTHGHCRL